MRTTRASTAIERLKERTGNPRYVMARTGAELFFLTEGPGLPPLCAPLELDDFVKFVNALGPQKVRRVSKLDVVPEGTIARSATSIVHSIRERTDAL